MYLIKSFTIHIFMFLLERALCCIDQMNPLTSLFNLLAPGGVPDGGGCRAQELDLQARREGPVPAGAHL